MPKHIMLNAKSLKRDNEMTNMGYYDWICKTPVCIRK